MRTFFISSTFRDMHKERDEMYRQMVPMLSKEAFENGDTIAIRDLRWGVNTSDEKSEEEVNRKVLSVCLDEIDECRPYMIILLGYRYGFCPGKELIAQTVKDRNALVRGAAEDAGAVGTPLRSAWRIARPECEDVRAPQSKIGGISRRGQDAPLMNRNALRSDGTAENEMSESDAENGGEGVFVLTDENISVTEMEIRYGAFWKRSESASPRILVYIRDIEACDGLAIPNGFLQENEKAWERQRNLIQDVRALAEAHPGEIICKNYQMKWGRDERTGEGTLLGAGDFIRNQVIPDVRELLEQEWSSAGKLTDFEKELQKHREYADTKRKNYFVRESIVRDVRERLGFDTNGERVSGPSEKRSNLLVLRGETGCGKTALMSYLAEQFEDPRGDTRVFVLLLFCGYTSSVCRALDIEKAIVEFLEGILQEEHLGERLEALGHAALHARMEALVERFQTDHEGKQGEKRRLLLMLDAVDQLDADEMRDHLTFLPGNLSGNVQVILSCTPQLELPFGDGENILNLKPLSDGGSSSEGMNLPGRVCAADGANSPDGVNAADGENLSAGVHSLDGNVEMNERTGILRQLFRSHGKEPYDEVLQAIGEKKNSDNPLYLSLIVQRLVMLEKRDYEEIDKGKKFDPSNADYQIKIIRGECADDTSGMCVNILNYAIEKLSGGDPRHAALFRKVIQYISASRFGLRDTDLEQIINSDADSDAMSLEDVRIAAAEGPKQMIPSGAAQESSRPADSPEGLWNTLDFTRFFWYMRQLFIIREDGRYDFSHAGIRESYKNWCRENLQSESEEKIRIEQQKELKNQPPKLNNEVLENAEKNLHIQILNHLKNHLEETDPVRINEFIYHCRHADDKTAFVEYICGYRKIRAQKDGADSHGQNVPDNARGSVVKKTQNNVGSPIMKIYTVAAREIRQMCIEDARNSAAGLTDIWLCQVLESCNPWLPPAECQGVSRFLFGADQTYDLLYFLYECLEPAFGDSDEEIRIQKSLYEIGYQRAAELYDKKLDAQSLSLLIRACFQMGEICQQQGGLWNYNTALRMYTEAQEWSAKLAERPGEKSEVSEETGVRAHEMPDGLGLSGMGADQGFVENLPHPDRKLMENLSRERDNLSHLGDIYAAMAGRENRNRALRLYRNALEMEERIQGCAITDRRDYPRMEKTSSCASATDRAGSDNDASRGPDLMEKGQELSEKGLELLRKIGDMLMEGSWECRQQGLLVLKKILLNTAAPASGTSVESGNGASKSAMDMPEVSGWENCEISDLLRYGDAIFEVFGAQEDTVLKAYRAAETIAAKRHREMPDVKNLYSWVLTRERVLFAEGMAECLAKDPAKELANCQTEDSVKCRVEDPAECQAKAPAKCLAKNLVKCLAGSLADLDEIRAGEAAADEARYQKGYARIYSDLAFLEQKERHGRPYRQGNEETSLRLMRTRAVCLEHEGYLLLHDCEGTKRTKTVAYKDCLKAAREKLLEAREILEDERWDREAIDVRRDRMAVYSNLGDLFAMAESGEPVSTETPSHGAAREYYEKADRLAEQLKKELATPSACADAITVRLRLGELLSLYEDDEIGCAGADLQAPLPGKSAEQRECYISCLEDALSLAFETGAPSDMQIVSGIYRRLADLEQTEDLKKDALRRADLIQEKAEAVYMTGASHPAVQQGQDGSDRKRTSHAGVSLRDRQELYCSSVR